MGFDGIKDQNKQRISLLPETAATIEHDIADFGLKGRSELVNLVLSYKEKYNLTQESQLATYRHETADLLKEANLDPDKDDILDRLCDTRKTRIINNINETRTHRRGNVGYYIRISNSVRRWLESPDNTENAYYSSLESYINQSIEEYATKDYYSRERIILDKKISEYEAYIRDKVWIDIYRNDSLPAFKVYPCRIMPDKFHTHVYLACYALSEDMSLSPMTFRLSALPPETRISYGCDVQISNDDLKKLEDLINERGIQFLSENAIDITVRLTPAGQKAYARTARLRPDPISEEPPGDNGDKILKFHCTLSQARYYFASFGKEAEIMSPAGLREIFRLLYQEAIKNYQ